MFWNVVKVEKLSGRHVEIAESEYDKDPKFQIAVTSTERGASKYLDRDDKVSL